jgi:hypothetical protein
MRTVAAFVFVTLCASSPAAAQRFTCDRSFDVDSSSLIDVSTVRGKIDVMAGRPGKVVISGAVTIRVGFDVPANAPELARAVADRPPVERLGSTFRLRPPADGAEQHAVTVSYQVVVPPDTRVVTRSESGATTVRGISTALAVRTQSGAIELARLGGNAKVETGSGSVLVDDVGGSLTVTTSSSSFTGRSLHGDVRIRTSSGAIDAECGSGDIDVESRSSAIALRGVHGALLLSTQSGRVSIEGKSGRPWDVTTGSGSVTIALEPGARVDVNANSRSGTVTIEGKPISGTASKRSASGTLGGPGGPPLRVTTRSGAIMLIASR